jgi:hypothetical protein
VIALGSERDADAEFLKDVAARGGGRIHFTESADELPRLFAQEAITVARSSFVAEPTDARALPDMMLLGELPRSAFPTVDGYNLSYLRPGATLGVVTADEHTAPVLAFWHQGLGRIAALTAEVDGQYSSRLNAWADYQAFAIGLGRWLLGGEPPSGVHASIEREGGQGIVRIELDPDRARGSTEDVRTATATIVPPTTGAGAAQRITLAWVNDDMLEGRFPLQNAGLYLGAVQLGHGSPLPLAPLTLPYSPEFEPRANPEEGVQTLREIARVTGGVERTAWDGVFRASRLWSRQVRDLVLPLTLLLLTLHVIEIAGRRLLLFAAARERLRAVPVPRVRWRRPRAQPASGGQPTSEAAPARTDAPREMPQPARREPAESPLARAKQKARRRMGS